MNIFIHSHLLVVAIILAFWVPTWFLPSKFGFISENEGYIETDLDQYNTITFITYPINLLKMSDVRKYNITFTSMLSISKFTHLIIFEQSSEPDLHDKLYKILTSNFDESRISFITNEYLNETDSNQSSLTDFSATAISKVRTKFACYINANVAVDPFWYDRIMTLFYHFFEANANAHLYLTGRRIQIPLSKKEIKEFTNLPTTTSKNFFKSLRKLIRSKKEYAKCIKQCESDYFLVTADPAPFDLRYLPEFRLTGGFFSMYLNYLAESKENSFSANEQVPVYYLGSLPDVDDQKYKEDSQYNYDIIKNNSYHVTKNFDLPSSYNGKMFLNKWVETEINETSLSPFLSNVNCSDENDMANINLTSFSTIDHHQIQNDNFNQDGPNNFGFDGDQNPIQNDENNDDYYNKKEKNSDDDEDSKKNKNQEDKDEKDESNKDKKNKKKDESTKNKNKDDDEKDELKKDKKKDDEDQKENKKKDDDENTKNEKEDNSNKKNKNKNKEKEESNKKKNDESNEDKKKKNEEEELNENKKKKNTDKEESIKSKKNKKKDND